VNLAAGSRGAVPAGVPGGAQGRARRWLVCADDYAIDAGAVDGIAELIERGRVTATSALVDAPLWPAAAAAIAGPAGGRRAALGLHLNLTQAFARRGTARTAARIAPTWPLGELILRCTARAISRSALRATIERQLDAFEDAVGRRPDYVDGHQHVHQFAVVREELVAALLRRYRDGLPWLRSTRPPAGVREFKARGIAALGERGLRRLARAAGIRSSAFLVGVYDFRPDRAAYWQHLRHWLAVGPDATALMCHPSRQAGPGDPIAAARTMEHAALASEDFAAALADAGIELVAGLF
jgi:predicted glycoside hydrolase/deacetylase ChbG (UPF0249 family)